MGKKIQFVFVLILLVFTSACSLESIFNKDDDDHARTYYETLDLSTPEEAVKTFTEAFQREDFMTVYLVLDQRTQFFVPQMINMRDYHLLFHFENWEDIDEIIDDVSCLSDGLGSGEHSCSDMLYVFDELMLSAKDHDALWIDLSGEVEIIDTEDSETVGGDDAVDVIASVEGIEDEVLFRMVESNAGRWRVQVVIVDGGGDEAYGPWSVPGMDD